MKASTRRTCRRGESSVTIWHSPASAPRQQVLDGLHCESLANQAPAETYAKLLDQGTYVYSIRTMYRVFEASQEVRERRNQFRHPVYAIPQLVAMAPTQVCTWHIMNWISPAKWTYYCLYAILDIYRRYVARGCSPAGTPSISPPK